MKAQNCRTQENQISKKYSGLKHFAFSFGLWLMAGTLILAMNAMASNNDVDTMWENENPDAVSKWGAKSPNRFSELDAQRSPTLQPISGSSFTANTIVEGPTQVGNRGPASVTDADGNTAPVAPISNSVTRALSKSKSVQEVALIANDLGFFPSTIFVTQGIPVRLYITGASKRSQCFMLESYGIRKQIQTGKIEEITFMPDSSGTYLFSCPMSGAKGSLLVKSTDGERFPASVQTGRHPAVPVSINKTNSED